MITFKATISTENSVTIKYEVIYSKDSQTPETPWQVWNSKRQTYLSAKCVSIYGHAIEIKYEQNLTNNTKSQCYSYELPQDPLKALLLLNHLVCMIATNNINEFYFDNEPVPKVESERKAVSEFETGFALVERWINKIIDLKSAPHYANVITAFKKYKHYYEHVEQDFFKEYKRHSYASSHIKYCEDQAALDDILTLEHNPLDSQKLAKLGEELKKTKTKAQFVQIINDLRLQGLTNFYRVSCIGKKAHDGGNFTEGYTEFSFLKEARFSLVDNLLRIEKISEIPFYQDYYAPDKKFHSLFVDEMQWLAKTAGLNLIHCDHSAIAFDEESSQKLMQWGIHADADYVESLLKEQKLPTFFSSASKKGHDAEEKVELSL